MKRIRNMLLGLSVVAMATPAQALRWKDYQNFSQGATSAEHKNKWQQINWMTDFDAAQRRAMTEQKPILVFMVVSFRGDKNATDC